MTVLINFCRCDAVADFVHMMRGKLNVTPSHVRVSVLMQPSNVVVPVVASQNGNNGNAGERSRNWCLRPSTKGVSARVRGYYPEKIFEIVYVQNPAI